MVSVSYSGLSVGTVLHDRHCKHCMLSSLVKWTDAVVEQAGTLGRAMNRTEQRAVNVAGKLTVFCSRAASALLLCSPIFCEMLQNRAEVRKNILFDVSSLSIPASFQCPV